LGVFRILLNSRDSPQCGTLGADEVLECNAQQVALVTVDFGSLLLKDWSQEVDHIIEALSLLGDTGHKDVLLY
jgi:hypothetical protein